MSKLLDYLDRIGRGNSRAMGFGTLAQKDKLPSMVLVARVSGDFVQGVQTASEAKADAVLLVAGTELDEVLQDEVLDGLKAILWGVSLQAPTPEAIGRLKEKGCDFLLVTPADTPVDVLEEGEIARALAVDPGMKEELLRTIEELPVDIVVMESRDISAPLTLKALMDISAVRGQFGKYFFLQGVTPKTRLELQSLRDIGVDGLVVEAGKAAEGLAQLRELSYQLPQRKPRHERPAVLLPSQHLASSTPAHREDEEEDGEEDSEG